MFVLQKNLQNLDHLLYLKKKLKKIKLYKLIYILIITPNFVIGHFYCRILDFEHSRINILIYKAIICIS